jgi:hypothetical protein
LFAFASSDRWQSLLTEDLCVLEQVLVQVFLQCLVLGMWHTLQALDLQGTALVAGKLWL